jgi:hypothetical protein
LLLSPFFFAAVSANFIKSASGITTLFLSRRPTQQYSFEKLTPIFIYKLILSTNFKKQQTFITQFINYTNAEQFKAVGLEELVMCL